MAGIYGSICIKKWDTHRTYTWVNISKLVTQFISIYLKKTEGKITIKQTDLTDKILVILGFCIKKNSGTVEEKTLVTW